MEILFSDNYVAISPGESIKDILESHCMTQEELSKRMGISAKHLSNIITSKVSLTEDIAFKLEMVFDVSHEFWQGLESKYRENLIKVNEENRRKNVFSSR